MDINPDESISEFLDKHKLIDLRKGGYRKSKDLNGHDFTIQYHKSNLN